MTEGRERLKLLGILGFDENVKNTLGFKQSCIFT